MHIVKKGRMVSVLLTIVLVLGLFQGNCADAASADDRYTSYNASSILKRYSVFVQRNYTANNHIIGAIAVGGTYKNSNFFGDVMTFPSYINNWESGGLGNGAVNSGVLNYLRSYGQSFGRVVYYGTKSVGVSGENIIQNPGYINMDSAFSSLRSQSQALKERGTALSGNTLNLNGVETDVYVTISSDKLNSLNIQVPSYTWFRSHTLVISVTGSSIDYNGWSIKINGRDIGNNFRSSFPGATTDYNVQLNCTGMNLFWNFPDATRVNAQGFAGHMIAPKADVTINSGNFEGGIIARSFTSNSEAHFYPCSRSLPRNNNDLSPTPTPTNSPAPTATNSPAPTATNSPAPTATNSPAPTNSPTPTTAVKKSNTPTPTTAVKKSNTPTPTVKANSPTPTKAVKKSNTPTPTTAVKKSNTPTPTVKANSPTPTKAVKKSNTPTPTTAVKKSNTPTPTPTTVVQKTNTPTPTTVVKKTNTPTPTTVLQKTNTPTPTTEVQRTNTPTPTTQAPTPTQAEEGPTPTTKVTTPTPTPYRRPTATPKPVREIGSEIDWKSVPEGYGHGVFSKQTTAGEELEGAILTLTCFTEGIDLSKITRTEESGGKDYKATRNKITWTSTTTRTVLQDLPNGLYRLHEDCSPANYDVASDIFFRMNGGVICDINGNPFPDGVLVMIDASLTDPGHSGVSGSAVVPPVKNALGSEIRSPQTSDGGAVESSVLWAILLGIVAVVMLGIGLQLTGKKRAEKVKVEKDKKRC